MRTSRRFAMVAAVATLVLFSGTLHPRNVKRIVELGDGWIPIVGATSVEVADGIARLRDEYAAAGRDPDTLRVQASARSMDAVPDLAAAGVTTILMFARLHDGGVDDLVSRWRATSGGP